MYLEGLAPLDEDSREVHSKLMPTLKLNGMTNMADLEENGLHIIEEEDSGFDDLSSSFEEREFEEPDGVQGALIEDNEKDNITLNMSKTAQSAFESSSEFSHHSDDKNIKFEKRLSANCTVDLSSKGEICCLILPDNSLKKKWDNWIAVLIVFLLRIILRFMLC